MIKIIALVFVLTTVLAPMAQAEKTTSLTNLCAAANQEREGICRIAKVNCAAVLKKAGPARVEKIRQCPIRSVAKSWKAPSGISAGMVPCCVQMGQTEK